VQGARCKGINFTNLPVKTIYQLSGLPVYQLKPYRVFRITYNVKKGEIKFQVASFELQVKSINKLSSLQLKSIKNVIYFPGIY
jgi:hypothetical protein